MSDNGDYDPDPNEPIPVSTISMSASGVWIPPDHRTPAQKRADTIETNRRNKIRWDRRRAAVLAAGIDVPDSPFKNSVWVLFGAYYDEAYVVAVCSTEEKATRLNELMGNQHEVDSLAIDTLSEDEVESRTLWAGERWDD